MTDAAAAPAETAAPEAVAPETPSLLNAVATGAEPMTLGDGEWALTATQKGTGDMPAWFKADKYNTVADQAEAYKGLESKLGAFTGAPETYVQNVPEGFEGEFAADDPLLTGFTEWAQKSGVNQDGYDELISMYINATTETPEQTEAARSAELHEILGPNHQQTINEVSGQLANTLSAEALAAIKPFMTHPETIKALEIVNLANAPKVAPINGGTNPDGVTMEGLNALRNERFTDGPNKGAYKFHHDSALRAKIEAYSTELHGTD